jgi:hypothetical protein
MVHSNRRRDGEPVNSNRSPTASAASTSAAADPDKSFRFLARAQLPASLQRNDAIIAREFSDTREQEMIAPRRLAIKIALAAFLIMCNPPKIFFADCDILKTNFSSGPLAPLVERRKDSVRRGLFRQSNSPSQCGRASFFPSFNL